MKIAAKTQQRQTAVACPEREHPRRCPEQTKADTACSCRNEIFIYRVDRTDTIIRVSNNWCAFAHDNHWSGSPPPEEVVGQTLWRFIKGIETQHLYQALFKRARAGTPSRSIPFRCDAPWERRFLDLTLEALPDGQIEITSTIRRTETRNPVKLLDAKTPRSPDLLRICSMCKKVHVESDQWFEIETALAHLKTFEADKVPQLTHGLCPACYQAAMQELDGFEETLSADDRR